MEKEKINILEAKNKYQALIKNSNFDEINNFNDNLIPERIILSQSGDDERSFSLTQKQYEALIKSMEKFKEDYCYRYICEGYKKNEFIVNDINELLLITKNMSFKDYKKYDTLLENIVYSSQENWAIILTMEDYGILAATEEFMTEYKKNYPNWKEDIEKFKYYFDAPNFNLTVVEKLFNYVTENADDLTIEEKTLPWKNNPGDSQSGEEVLYAQAPC
ncbi:hypothetical protein, partial [Fusobacterium ulcerans]|uniref:hypothetical protein n=1 Tax=Fusobacterium ulcerans TaxID=861 RepID=UPI0026719A61